MADITITVPDTEMTHINEAVAALTGGKEDLLAFLENAIINVVGEFERKRELQTMAETINDKTRDLRESVFVGRKQRRTP